MTAKPQPAPTTSSTDRIEKKLVVRAPRSRVWRAIANATEFGTWFGMSLNREFAEGATVRGQMTNPKNAHLSIDFLIEKIDPEHYFSYRWHPYAFDTAHDYSTEPMTLVEFILEDAAGGTSITIIESGFDRVAPSRRVEAFRMNEKGWESEAKNLERHVS